MNLHLIKEVCEERFDFEPFGDPHSDRREAFRAKARIVFLGSLASGLEVWSCGVLWFRDCNMGGCQNYGPFLGPYYNTAPII